MQLAPNKKPYNDIKEKLYEFEVKEFFSAMILIFPAYDVRSKETFKAIL